MINFIIGVAVGTAFAPFWMWVYTQGKLLVKSKMQNKTK